MAKSQKQQRKDKPLFIAREEVSGRSARQWFCDSKAKALLIVHGCMDYWKRFPPLGNQKTDYFVGEITWIKVK